MKNLTYIFVVAILLAIFFPNNSFGQNSYCITENINNFSNFYINKVEIGDIQKSSAGSTGAYNDYSELSTSIKPLENIEGSIEVSVDGWQGSWTPLILNVWIDYNQDGEFSNNDEQFQYRVNAPSKWSSQLKTISTDISIPVPENAKTGQTRLRVGFVGNVWGDYTACDFNYLPGEVEDYTLQIDADEDYISFEGTTKDYISFGDNFDLQNTFTIEAWVLQLNNNGMQTIASKGNSKSGAESGYNFYLENGKVGFSVYNNAGNLVSNSIASDAINVNKWHHVALAINKSKIQLFVDGIKLVDKKISIAAQDITEPFLLGGMYRSNNKKNPIYNFNGYIDEVRIWNKKLTAADLKLMMNQEIEDNGAIQGKFNKQNSEKLNWSDLLGYYNFNDFTATDSSNSQINGEAFNMNNNQPQNAPLPYTTVRDGEWHDDSATTPWAYGNSVWNIPNTTGVNGKAINWNIVEINHAISLNKSTSVSSLTINSANELIVNGTTGSDGKGTGFGLTVLDYLKIDGVLDLEGESQLIQTEGSVFDIASTGSLERDQQGTADVYTYNYLSSPVGVTAEGNKASFSYTLKEVMPAINFIGGYDGNVAGVISLAEYWIWKFNNKPSGDYSEWQHVKSTGKMLAGEGFTLKGSGAGAITEFQNYTFVGKPNNGDILLPINKGNDYLVGNPYPSALDADQFILDNGPTIEGASSNITGTLYFWEHWGGNSHNLAAYLGGYATYNLSGGVATGVGNRAPESGAAKIPGRYIPVGQGFFVEAANDGEITFNNGQRKFKKENSNSVLMKLDKAISSEIEEEEDTRTKIRIGFEAPEIESRQILLTIDDRATEAVDWGFDGKMIDELSQDMFWNLSDSKYAIQALPVITNETEIPLGIIMSEPGLAKINLDLTENFDESKNIFIKDTETGNTHNLSASSFEINLPEGDFSNRFRIVFQPNETLGVEDELLKEGLHIFVNNQLAELQIKNTTDSEITGIQLYSILGQNIQSWGNNLDRDSLQLSLSNTATGVYIVRVKTTTGIISKKVIVE